MTKSITGLMGCLAILLTCHVGHGQDNVLGGALNAQTNAGATAQGSSNNPVQAGLQGAANAALNGQDVRGSIQQGVRGALQNEANRIQGNVQGGVQGNGQAEINNSNLNGQLGTQSSANLQQNFRAQLLDNVQFGTDGRMSFEANSNSQLQGFGFQPRDQVVDPNGRVVTNAQEIAAIAQRNGQIRVLRNGQLISINTSMQQGGQQQTQNHQQLPYQSQSQSNQQMSASMSASVMAKLDKIDQLVREVRAELNASQR